MTTVTTVTWCYSRVSTMGDVELSNHQLVPPELGTPEVVHQPENNDTFTFSTKYYDLNVAGFI